MANDELSKTANENVTKGLLERSNFGDETNVKFDGLKVTKFTPSMMGKLAQRKKAEIEKAEAAAAAEQEAAMKAAIEAGEATEATAKKGE